MASNIHIKFKSELTFKGLRLLGPHLSVSELIDRISAYERIDTSKTALELSNYCTNRVYTDPDELIPKNTSVIIKRLPLESRKRKHHQQMTQMVTGCGQPTDFLKDNTGLSEDERIDLMKQQSRVILITRKRCI